jgi:hypothetical protein
MIGLVVWAQAIWWLVGLLMVALAVLLWHAESDVQPVSQRSHQPV